MSKLTITDFLEARIAEDEMAAYDLMGEREGDRVLAECAAKRAIIAMHDTYSHAAQDAVGIAFVGARGGQQVTAEVIRALAAVYSSHEDYDSGWAL